MRAGLLAAAAAIVLACLGLPSAALAGAPLTLGFSNASDGVLTASQPATESFWVKRAQAEGTQMVKLAVSWRDVAPAHRPHGFQASDPSSSGYNWTAVDQEVRDLTAGGFKILLMVVSAPNWAEGRDLPKGYQPGVWKPNAADLGAFATALARRYSGHFADPLHPGRNLPRVSYWQAWNEPNLSIDLAPQWIKLPTGPSAESPVLYRAMENAFYAAVKGVNRSNFVVQAGVAPYGDYPPGGARMSPVNFDRVMFCLDSKLDPEHCGDPVHLDAIDSHPYGIYGPTWHALDSGDVAVPDVDKLAGLLHDAERGGTVLPRGPKQDWVTEISWDTKPPNPQGVPVAKEALWLEQALFVLWGQGVNTVLWFQLADAPPIPSYELSYEGGTYYLNGAAKPGATAFRFPFVTNRVDDNTVEAWGRAPSSGTVLIQMRSGGTWRTVRTLPVAAGHVFETMLPLSGSAQLRAQIAGDASLTWSQAAPSSGH